MNAIDSIIEKEELAIFGEAGEIKYGLNRTSLYYKDEVSLFYDLRVMLIKGNVSDYQLNKILKACNNLLPQLEKLLLDGKVSKGEVHELMQTMRLCVKSVEASNEITYKNSEYVNIPLFNEPSMVKGLI